MKSKQEQIEYRVKYLEESLEKMRNNVINNENPFVVDGNNYVSCEHIATVIECILGHGYKRRLPDLSKK